MAAFPRAYETHRRNSATDCLSPSRPMLPGSTFRPSTTPGVPRRLNECASASLRSREASMSTACLTSSFRNRTTSIPTRASVRRVPRGGVMSGCSRSGGFVCLRSLRNSTNRIGKQRELSRTAAGIHTSSARWSCSLCTTNTVRSLWPGQSAFYATGHSRRLFSPAPGRGVRHRHVIMRWGTYSGGGKGGEAGDRRTPGVHPAGVSIDRTRSAPTTFRPDCGASRCATGI